MAVWLIRAGKHGEDEDAALETGYVIIGWREMPDISGVAILPHISSSFPHMLGIVLNRTWQHFWSAALGILAPNQAWRRGRVTHEDTFVRCRWQDHRRIRI
jgi:hypothetical protein